MKLGTRKVVIIACLLALLFFGKELPRLAYRLTSGKSHSEEVDKLKKLEKLIDEAVEKDKAQQRPQERRAVKPAEVKDRKSETPPQQPTAVGGKMERDLPASEDRRSPRLP